MRKITSIVAFAAALYAGLATVSAQTPTTPQTPASPQTPTTPRTTQPTTQAGSQQPSGAMMTIVGCLKEEKDIPTLKPNMAERAGITEDYILTEVKAAPSNPVSGLALGTMYEIEGIAESELKKHLGHQVEIQGRLDTSSSGTSSSAASSTAPTGTDSRDRADVPDFNATSLKMVSATCSAK